MPAPPFAVPPAVLATASAGQRRFLEELAGVVHRLRPPDLDTDAVTAVVERGSLLVDLPHRRDPALHVAVRVGDGEGVVAYGIERERFWADDPQAERLWPVRGTSAEAAVVAFVEQLLAGRIVLEVRQRLFFRATRSSWIAPGGHLERFARNEVLRPSLATTPWRRTVFDFGGSVTPG